MKKIIQYTAFPILLLSFSWITIDLIQKGTDKSKVLLIMSIIVFLTMYALERVIPYKKKWNHEPELKNDLFHNVFGTFLGASIGNILTINIFGNLGIYVSNLSNSTLWPSQLPIVIQVIIIFLVADLGRYIQHRLHHSHPLLWKMHELHHDSPNLNVFKAGRNSIIERIFQQIFMYSFLFFLGVPDEIFIYFLIPNSFLGTFVHSNTDLRIGPFEYLIMGPNAHKIHHSIDMKEGNSNFGSALVVWDLVFGTYISPKKYTQNNRKIEVGVKKRNISNDNILRQALYPFFKKQN